METKGCSQQWKMRLPEFKHSGGKDIERDKTEKKRDTGGPQKSVTMAPTSRYLSDRQYVMRKPLFSVEQHTSILKKTHPQKVRRSTHLLLLKSFFQRKWYCIFRLPVTFRHHALYYVIVVAIFHVGFDWYCILQLTAKSIAAFSIMFLSCLNRAITKHLYNRDIYVKTEKQSL